LRGKDADIEETRRRNQERRVAAAAPDAGFYSPPMS
jgi:hypothetical protein